MYSTTTMIWERKRETSHVFGILLPISFISSRGRQSFQTWGHGVARARLDVRCYRFYVQRLSLDWIILSKVSKLLGNSSCNW